MANSEQHAHQIVTFGQESPPLQFGARRLHYQYSVAIPQIHLILVSILQGVVFSLLLYLSPPVPLSANAITLDFFLHAYFYLPYIITSLIILIAWLDFVYASAVLIWPPSAFQVGLIYLLAVAEVFMVKSVEHFPLWVSGCGMVTIIGGIMRCNNYRIFTEEDFEQPQVGKTVLRNELWYGLGYIALGVIGVSYGLGFDLILHWIRHLHLWGVQDNDRLLHWISYINLMIDVGIILQVDVRYRRYLLRELTSNTDIQMTDHGGIRYKPVSVGSLSESVPTSSSQSTESALAIEPTAATNTSTINGPMSSIEVQQELHLRSKQRETAGKITKPLEIVISGHSEREGA